MNESMNHSQLICDTKKRKKKMGGAASKQEELIESKELRDLESQAASVAALPLLESSFSALSSSSETQSIPVSSLENCFSLKYNNINGDHNQLLLFDQMGSAITQTLFKQQEEDTCVTWVEFVRGYVSVCGRMSTSSLLNILFRVVSSAAQFAGFPFHLQFDTDTKIDGFLSPRDLWVILNLCWVMEAQSQAHEMTHLPDVTHLLLSAILFCTDDKQETDDEGVVWGSCSDLLNLETQLPAWKIQMWVITTVPYLPNCFSAFINSALTSLIKPNDSETQKGGTASSSSSSQCLVLTSGRAWALSLSQRGSIRDQILRIAFPCTTHVLQDTLLYRSGSHGKGMNRFWANVEGYHGPVLVLISATSGESSESSRKWIIGALTQQGFENKDVFYGDGGYLYSIGPVFHGFSALGKEQNFVYSHLHPAVRAYDPHPKPVGIGFGGSAGNERIFIDEDFAKVTLRHHAVDKTYQHGPLFPNQGYLPVEASILDMEVWGLGGKAAKAVQMSYKKREELFSEQRRKIDLKTFANWEDSPEKMMMDMMGNPNAVRREER